MRVKDDGVNHLGFDTRPEQVLGADAKRRSVDEDLTAVLDNVVHPGGCDLGRLTQTGGHPRGMVLWSDAFLSVWPLWAPVAIACAAATCGCMLCPFET